MEFSIIQVNLVKHVHVYMFMKIFMMNLSAKFVEKTKKLKLGNPFDKETHVGAIIDQDQLDVIDGYVQSAIEDGAEILAGGKASCYRRI